MDEAGVAAHLRGKGPDPVTVGVRDIERTVARMAKIPERTVSATDRVRLQSLDEDLKRAVFGQDAAVGAVARAIKLARSGLGHPDRPVGAFLFAGPTGVGKTEVARQLAKVMGVEFIRFDMSEYMERHTVSRLIGAPPGYVGFDQGGLLTDAINRTPHCVLLLDEIEKAHPDLFSILLQVMDHATLTDNNGRKADFRNVILVMTTNAGAQELSRSMIGFGTDLTAGNPKIVIDRMFNPEFRNRLSAIIEFAPLTPPIIERVVDKFIGELAERLEKQKVKIEVSAAARSWLAGRGFDPQIRRAAAGAADRERDRPRARRRDPVRPPVKRRRSLGRSQGRRPDLQLTPKPPLQPRSRWCQRSSAPAATFRCRSVTVWRILSPLSLSITTRNHWAFFFQHVKLCKFMCKF